MTRLIEACGSVCGRCSRHQLPLRENGTQLGLAWLLEPSTKYPREGAVWKDGELIGTNTYIIFLPWVDSDGPSEAGVFVMTNCDGLMLNNTQVVAAIANDVLLTMQGVTPPEDKSGYPRAFGR